MKKITLLVFAFISLNAFAQNKYLTKTGTVNFEASVPSFEEVKASNKATTAILNTENGEFAALVLVNGFRFKNALMEEHFNENYAESETYPKATFKGKITGFSLDDINVSKTYMCQGSLNFHGQTKTIENIEVVLSKDGETITMTGQFKTKASDYDIDIPKVVSSKIAQDILVSFEFSLNKK